MLRIEHSEALPTEIPDDPRSATKRYADALWRNHPRISPDWWREAQGHTLGKVALDARCGLQAPHGLAEGCNLLLTTPFGWPSVQAALATLPEAEACVCLLMQPDAAWSPTSACVPVWSPQPHADAATRAHNLQALEQAVREGRCEAYGLHMPAGSPLPLHLWLQEAAAAAHAAWGRNKRPALRWLVLEQDLANLSHLTQPVTRHRDEAVSTLELASRLGLAVVVVPQVVPAPSTPPPAALAALTALAEAEAALHQVLGGWPQQQGQQVFSVLAALGQGQAPWPTPYLWQAWQTQLWPPLRQMWHQLAQQQQGAPVGAYLAAWEALQPHGEALAQAAVQPWLADVLEQVNAVVPEPLQGQAPLGTMLTVLTALPAVTAVAVPVPPVLEPLRDAPGLADVAAVLAGIR